MKTIKKYSEELQQYIEVTEINKGIYIAKTEDGTLYNQGELQKLSEAKVKTPLQVHLIKSLFKGTIIKVGE